MAVFSRLTWLFPAPPECALCARPVFEAGTEAVSGVLLCSFCQEGIHWIRPPLCARCGRGMAPGEGERCLDCLRVSDGDWLRNRAVTQYSPLAREVVSLFKYRGKETLAIPCGKLMADVVKRSYKGETVDAVTYVPLHPRREAERGFNQAERLAQVVGRELRRPVVSLLSRERDAGKQSQKSRRDRLRGMDGVFVFRPDDRRSDFRSGTLLLVDDVYTTGATLSACARVLVQAGAATSVLAVTFAR